MSDRIPEDDPLPRWFRQSLLYRFLFVRLWNWKRLARVFARKLHYRVAGGFASGMVYLPNTRWGNTANKLAGTYEQELLPVWESVDRSPPERVFDVGAAEGYYAVGALLRWPSCHVVAWESDADSRAEMGKLARMNGVETRLTILGDCSAFELERRIASGSPDLIIMDVEGMESDLCTPGTIRQGARAIWVIETHCKRVLNTLIARFAQTHEVEVIENELRSASDCPVGAAGFYSSYDRWRLVQEGRPFPTPWLVARPALVKNPSDTC